MIFSKYQGTNFINNNMDRLPTLNQKGYQSLGNNTFSEAIAIFKLNTETFPEDGNVYDSLGDFYLPFKDTLNAIKAYETAVAKGFNVSMPKIPSVKKDWHANS